MSNIFEKTLRLNGKCAAQWTAMREKLPYPIEANKRGISEQCLPVTEAETKTKGPSKFNITCTFLLSMKEVCMNAKANFYEFCRQKNTNKYFTKLYHFQSNLLSS